MVVCKCRTGEMCLVVHFGWIFVQGIGAAFGVSFYELLLSLSREIYLATDDIRIILTIARFRSSPFALDSLLAYGIRSLIIRYSVGLYLMRGGSLTTITEILPRQLYKPFCSDLDVVPAVQVATNDK